MSGQTIGRLTFITFILVFLVGSSSYGNTPLTVGDQVTHFSALTLENKPFNYSDVKAPVVIVNFWASWCIPCRQELPFFSELYRDYKEKGLEILAVNVDRKKASAQKFVADVPLPFPVLLDSDHAIIERFAPPALPGSYVVDGTGKIRFVHRGFTSKDKKKFQNEIDSLLLELKEKEKK